MSDTETTDERNVKLEKLLAQLVELRRERLRVERQLAAVQQRIDNLLADELDTGAMR
jgi:tRNA uridine 5-carbamoylmethylation protein Kti12